MKTYSTIELIVELVIAVVFLVVVGFVLYGCTFPDPAPVSAKDCPAAQDHIEDLECHELLEIPGDDQVVGTEDDPQWEEWCEWVQDSGIDTLDLTCVLTASDCDMVERCLE